MKHLYQNAEVIYCAESLDHADKLFTRDMGESPQEMGDEFEQIPDDKPLEVGSDEPTGEPGEVARASKYKPRDGRPAQEGPVFYYVTRTAGEWAAKCEPGHFSGGDY